MINLVDRFKEHLQARGDALRCFCERGVQVEGWFKGEMIAFLDNERADFDREVECGQGRKKIDFQVTPASQPARIELKHWLIGSQRGTSYDACWYFRQGRNAKGKALSTGIQADFDKLSAIEGERYILIAMTRKPSPCDWQQGVHLFNVRARANDSRTRINSVTDVDQYPDYFFLGLLRLEAGR
jgi:hypothetical protein